MILFLKNASFWKNWSGGSPNQIGKKLKDCLYLKEMSCFNVQVSMCYNSLY